MQDCFRYLRLAGALTLIAFGLAGCQAILNAYYDIPMPSGETKQIMVEYKTSSTTKGVGLNNDEIVIYVSGQPKRVVDPKSDEYIEILSKIYIPETTRDVSVDGIIYKFYFTQIGDPEAGLRPYSLSE